MTSYLDTSFLMKLYINEADSAVAFQRLDQCSGRPVISWLSEVEMASAFHTRMGRGIGNTMGTELGMSYAQFRRERERGIYEVVATDGVAFARARLLCENYGAGIGVRALDVLHVAAAMHRGAEGFGTFDRRQGELAKACGLKLLA